MVDNYSEPEELLSDESFLAWYFQAGDEEAANWEHWMAAHPDAQDLVRQAVAILDTTRQLADKPVSPEQIERAQAALLRQIAAPITPFYKEIRWIAAACLLILLTTGILLSGVLHPRRTEWHTAYGQLSHQQLPDCTEVTLNANSHLSFAAVWKENAVREVWVKGEAFFHVHKTPHLNRFIVHTDHFDVVVTGTQFNVVNRPGKGNILLQEGSVLLQSPDGRELNMAPGDFVQYDSLHNGHWEKKPAKKESVLAWKEEKLVFDQTPLQELVSIVKDQYGVDLSLADDSLAEKKIVAILPNNNLDVLLRSLEATADFDISHQPNGGILIAAHRKDKN